MLYLAGSLLFGSGSARAQDPAPLPEKEVVVVDLFARNRTVPAVYVEAVRQQVLSAFADRGRHRIVDGETPGMLAGPPAGWGFVDPATVASVQSEFLQNRMQAMQDAGARYVVTGAIADYKFEHVSLPADSKKTPRPGFRATFQVILSAYDLQLGVPVPDQVYQLRGDAPVAEDADRKALSTLYGQSNITSTGILNSKRLSCNWRRPIRARVCRSSISTAELIWGSNRATCSWCMKRYPSAE